MWPHGWESNAFSWLFKISDAHIQYSIYTCIMVKWFLKRKKYWTHFRLFQIVIGAQLQNFNIKCCFLAWRRASENVDCYLGPKISFVIICKGWTWNKKCFSLLRLKAKNEEKVKKKIDFYFVKVKNHLAHFGGLN